MGGQPSAPNYDKKVNYRTYCDIIQDVTSGKFNLDLQNTKYEEISVEEEIIDELRPLKNIATDFVVNEFFVTELSLYRFMRLVYNTFDDALAIYRRKYKIEEEDLFFIYKGGNVLRIVSNEFLLELPNSATRKLTEFYSPFFKRSDADFSIYLNPKLENYDRIFKELGLITYLLQVHIRNKFLISPTDYFDFVKYNYKYQQEVLKKYLVNFDSVDGFQFRNLSIGNANALADREIYESKPDVAIQFIGEKKDNSRETMGAKFNITESGSYMVISYNSALDFRAGAESSRHVKFTLVRTKINFTLTEKCGKKLNIGGELIDVSIPHKTDAGLIHFFEHPKDNIEYFDLTYNGCDLKFKSYSIPYLINDLETILFKFNKYPWEDAKYVKRLNRLFYMYFVDIFMKIDNGVERLHILRDLRNLVLIQYAEYSTDIESGSNVFLEKYGRYNISINNLIHLMGDLLQKVKTRENVAKLQEMSNELLTNSDFVTETIQNIRQYCKHDGEVRPADIYQASSKELI